MIRYRLLIALLIFVSAACSQRNRAALRWTLDCAQTGAHVRDVLRQWEDLRTSRRGCVSPSGVDECAGLRAELDRLGQVCPSEPETLFTLAGLAYEDRNLFKAQQLLDQLLSAPAPHPRAAALRIRIAMEEGNLPYALRFSEQQIRLSPSDASLREVRASALFLSRRWREARQELEMAARLGAPKWRVAYHSGLIEEMQGNRGEAIALFQEALREKPGWAAVEARLTGLEAAK
ncbi:MAG: hypothetical protein J0L64_19285 [Acidobacteria bacterium]|nr:hypothetical protein [Acidobacteriota bacterium]